MSRAPIKAFLLDQRKVAGVGNIYADEALFRARIHPLRPARPAHARAGRGAARRVVASLEAGLAAKGASIDDFRHPDGVQGSFQDRFLIHLREGEPCLVLRAAGAQAARRRARDLRLRALPAAAAAQARRAGRPGGRSGRRRRAPESRPAARRR